MGSMQISCLGESVLRQRQQLQDQQRHQGRAQLPKMPSLQRQQVLKGPKSALRSSAAAVRALHGKTAEKLVRRQQRKVPQA